MALFGLGSIPKEIFICRVVWKVVAILLDYSLKIDINK